MDRSYIEEQKVISSLDTKTSMFGVFNAEGRLKGYIHVFVCGEVAIIFRILGHGDDIDKGIMYLLASEVIHYLIGLRRKQENLRWVMYDTFFGASSGLRYFKERLGFTPFLVKWSRCSGCSKEQSTDYTLTSSSQHD